MSHQVIGVKLPPGVRGAPGVTTVTRDPDRRHQRVGDQDPQASPTTTTITRTTALPTPLTGIDRTSPDRPVLIATGTIVTVVPRRREGYRVRLVTNSETPRGPLCPSADPRSVCPAAS